MEYDFNFNTHLNYWYEFCVLYFSLDRKQKSILEGLNSEGDKQYFTGIEIELHARNAHNKFSYFKCIKYQDVIFRF